MYYFTSRFWHPPHHPIITATIACIVGIALQSQFSLFVLLIPIALLAILHVEQKTQIIPHALPISFLLFFAAFFYEYQAQNHAHIMQQITHTDSLTVKIIDKESIKHNRRYKEWIIGEIKNTDLSPTLPFMSSWKIYIYQTKESSWLPGDILEITNDRMPSIKKNDFSWFLCKENVAATLFLSAKNKVQLIHRPTQSITRLLWQKRKNMLDIFEQHTSSAAFELASCIFWGNRTIIKQNPETKELFKKIGIVHYLARSGLHLIVFIFIWQLLFKAFCFAYRKKRITLLIIGLLYFFLTWPSVSFFRAFSLFAFFTIAVLNRMRTNIFYLLCLACTLFLVYNPMQLFFLDFQLTFGLTCALIWHNHVEYQIKLEASQNH